jgi:hypothetical protein
LIASIVDTHDLLEVVWVSIVAGVGLTAAYGVAILGVAQAVESGRRGYSAGAILFGVLGVAALAVVVAATAFGIVTLSDK